MINRGIVRVRSKSSKKVKNVFLLAAKVGILILSRREKVANKGSCRLLRSAAVIDRGDCPF